MNRSDFIKFSGVAATTFLTGDLFDSINNIGSANKSVSPLAITMWDFSWLERRWPGGSYEDWDKILDELVERGYNAIRIDAYPHLINANAKKEWTLLPVWDQHDWGSPGIIKVSVQPSLTAFISKCKKRKIKIGLSTWYREDVDNIRMKINSPAKMAENWIAVLDLLATENLMDSILYVDLCNEWPAKIWTPFFKAERKGHDWSITASMSWMKETVEIVSAKYPQLPYTFSMDHYQEGILTKNALPFLDFIEQHIWMSSLNSGEMNNKIGIDWNGFSAEDYKRTVEKAEALYRKDTSYWNKILTNSINQFAADAKRAGKAIITTECWALVNYKDYPMLKWDWIKELCATGITTAAATGQWVALATSNFCGPQFVGMWQDIVWHQKMTNLIRRSAISNSLLNSKITNKLEKT